MEELTPGEIAIVLESPRMQLVCDSIVLGTDSLNLVQPELRSETVSSVVSRCR